MVDKKTILGKLIPMKGKVMHKIGIAPFIFISVPNMYEKGVSPDFGLIKKYESESDITITYSHFEPDDAKESFQQLAKLLSKKHKVLLYEVAVEAGGGGADAEVIGFIYQQFQPVIIVISSLALNVASNAIYDLIKSIYRRKHNPIIKDQFTIQHTSKGVRYNYVFDNLDADIAIEASKIIPTKHPIRKSRVNYDVYLRYLPSKKRWTTFTP